MSKDVNKFCKSCDICQRTIPKGKVSKVPLGEMPIIEESFYRIAVDLIGPLAPVSERGHRYILTVVDYATRKVQTEEEDETRTAKAKDSKGKGQKRQRTEKAKDRRRRRRIVVTYKR
ncbi:hypothetical protein QZH41_004602 [Actinostola sp. cb2023]|nr:hypothetical protein QZH41_004602 [Actinostola sp. cb2023]